MRENPSRGAEKDERQTMRVREDVYDYITREASATTRTNPGQVEHMKKLHEAIKSYFGHDNVDVILAKIEEWKKRAGG